MISRPADRFTIVTPFAAAPEGNEKYEILHAEHEALLRATGWSGINGPFMDDGFRGPRPQASEIQTWLQPMADDFDEWWVPFGIHHPDHVLCAEAFRSVGRATARFARYEELPYRVLYPDFLSPIEKHRWPSENVAQTCCAARKHWLVGFYQSQVGPDLERHVYAYERIWR